MATQNSLLELTESYLQSLFADAVGTLASDFDTSAPFGELGIDSFRVLKLIKVLEADFGRLPKTLLFERFNVGALAQYFVEQHAATLEARFSGQAAVPAKPVVAAPVPAPATAAAPVQGPLRLLEADLPQYPELQARVQALFERHSNEGSVSRGTRNIAPNLFIGSTRQGYFNYSRCGDILLVYAYTGPQAYFGEIAGELLRHCVDKQYQLNFFVDQVLAPIDGVAFSATPFGALQRVHDLKAFTLDGGAMRRLRYQVSKFEKAGTARTAEYACGSDPATDRAIAAVIDRWCETKTMVNPLIHLVKDDILAGRLHARHRIFLTWLDEVLQNAILLSPMSGELNGHLMDLEFYAKDMPQGGLDYAIHQVIQVLAAEGCGMLSLGGTYGCRLGPCDSADPEVDRILDELHAQHIFNDESNLQFKNKFRPENRPIYLCRPVGSGRADNVIDIIMMIADPAKAMTPDDENHNVSEAAGVSAATPASGAGLIAGLPRSRLLRDAGFNPHNVPADGVDFDLKTDSWAQLDGAFVGRQMQQLRARLAQPAQLDGSLKAIFPFRHVLLTDAGRSADHVLCKAWPRRGLVLQNLLFPSCIWHQIDKGFTPVEIPHAQVFELDADEPFKGNLSWDALRQQVAAHAADIAYVCIEVNDNAAGGQPVSTQHLRQVRALLSAHAIPLVIDATRVLENARFLVERDPAHAGQTLWAATAAILSHADVVIGALAKDFCVDKGGLIATNDAALMQRFQQVLQEEGGGLDMIDRKLIALSLQNRQHIETQVLRKMAATQSIWQALKEQQVPVVAPAGGHCVLIDVKQLPEFAGLRDPVASCLAWLYVNTGIRGGAHSAGMQAGSALNGLVRLAIPVGLKQDEADEIAARLVRLFAQRQNIPEVSTADAGPDLHARHALVAWHRATGAAVDELAAPVAPSVSAVIEAVQPAAAAARPRGDIAIVGMAGRYPKARNLAEFWDNLRQGRDCVGEMPAERVALRSGSAFSKRYRGGFLDAVDRFDSLFFNISPREAEVLDPQERLFLEVAWEAIEDAGYHPEILADDQQDRQPAPVGVFVGAVWAMYQLVGVEEKLAGRAANPNSFLWSIANRVSYWMNLGGPSLAVDTACSSSLTALHLACEAIHNGDCRSALVGGVNLDLHQHKFDINAAGGALSADGLCRSFGAGANGYVAGEGAGALYLKPLEQALRDRDNIHGVIKGAVVNHGGRTSGYTVPNPKAQGELVAAALRKAGVDARSIGYVEAHGTGTELGDPVEISGLVRAFEGDGVAPQACAIGSVKTNIGHLEAAAGVVGVTKVLLQMKHRQLVPSLHSAQLNEHIDFAASPFQVPQRLQDWTAKQVDGAVQPLRAGVSSFGAGGANAHVVLEAVALPASPDAVPPGGHVFPLSARNDEQLREMAARLRRHLQDGAVQPLADVAFTLQHGRKSFEQRLAIVAETLPQLVDRLGLFLDGRADADVLSGHAKNAEGITRLLSRQERAQFVDLLSQGGDARKLAQLWIDGLRADCRLSGTAGRRTSLPTYPFADKRHWIAAGPGAPAAGRLGAAALHPLIDTNESTFQRQLFRKSFHASEFFVADHVVSGIPTLPGTAYLELARQAGEMATGLPVRRIRNVTWLSPLAVEAAAPTVSFIELKPAADTVLFEVFGETVDGHKRLHAQGKLVFDAGEAAGETLDLDAIRARCGTLIDAGEAYPLFERLGMRYGPSFQLLEQVRTGGDEVLGALRIPDVRSADFDAFVLHPSVLDAALQAGVMAQLADPAGEMKVPYSIGEVEWLHPLTRRCYSYLKRSAGGRGGVSKETVTIADEDGRVLLRIRDAVGVPLADVHKEVHKDKDLHKPADEGFSELFYAPAWQVSPLARRVGTPRSLLLFDTDDRRHEACTARGIACVLVLPGERFEALGDGRWCIDPRDASHAPRLLAQLAAQGIATDAVCYAWAGPGEPADEAALQQALVHGVQGFFFLCQALIEQKPAARLPLVWLGCSAGGSVPALHEAINGFVRSLRLENPMLDARVLHLLQDDPAPGEVLDAVLAELQPEAAGDLTVRLERGVRQVRTLRKLDAQALRPTGSVLKAQGVYLITGGAGGLGLIVAQHLAVHCQARLVLTGRSAPSPALETRLDALRQAGAQVLYVAADVARADDVARVLAAGRAQFGRIDGIVHAAGVLSDSLLRKKSWPDMAGVLAPKVFGCFHLDAQTQDTDLDFFACFSSLAALGGNTGQCDYAFANHYMDSFAAARERLRAEGRRSGRSLSLNWSLWADGGMKLDAPTEQFFRKNLGIRPLQTAVGLQAFVDLLGTPHAQVAVLEGVQARIEQAWGLAPKPVATPVPAPSVAAAAGDDLSAAVIAQLSRSVMEMLKIGADELALDSILLDLGFDSIGLAGFANAINALYGLDLNPILFFEYPSIRAIAGVLVDEHRAAVQAFHQRGAPAAPAATPIPQAVPQPIFAKASWAPAVLPLPAATREDRFAAMPIAIVGMAGVMPQSENLEAFWDHLKNARNLVTEIPRERWIWEDFDGNPLKEPNTSNSRWGGFMKEVDKFDPLFFGITPREAQMMDPQQRLFIETVWQAVEDAGQKVSDLSGTKTGLFVGVSASDYIDVLSAQQSSLDGYSASGNSHSILANRVSYLLNLRGPSAPIDTACSSSLVALHRAIESIHTGSSDMAIVGGVQVMLTPVAHISLSAAGMLSTDGKCKTFSKDANGYVRGEGVGAIFIKPLARALADGNPVHAVIRATAENHGGRVTNLTAPNPKAQAELLVEAWGRAQVDPATAGYIECHGTGTSLGDPIEIQALKKAFADLYRQHGKPAPVAPHCGLSSVKTNIGHLEPAAGMAGLLKVLLAMRHRQIPALLHFDEPNPYIDLKGSPFFIADRTVPWPAPQAADGTPLPRRAGVSAFGWGGANAHVVLEEYVAPARSAAGAPAGPQLLVLSARNPERLRDQAQALLAHAGRHALELGDLAYTLQVGRDAMVERLGFVAHSLDEALAMLGAFVAGGTADGLVRGRGGRKKDEPDLIGQDEDIKASVIDQLVGARKWGKLLELWVSGLDLDWQALQTRGAFGAGEPRRLHLPGYPFARERHWIATATKAVAAAPAPAAELRVAEASQRLFFRETWEAQAAPLPLPRGPASIVVFADDSLLPALRDRRDALVVPAGEQARLADADSLRQLLSQAGRPGEPLEIVHAWSRGRQAAGVHGLFELFKAIRGLQRPVPHVTLVGDWDPARAETCWDNAWIGFERSLKLHLPKTAVSLLYTDGAGATAAQLQDGEQHAGAVWYRGGRRHVLACQPFELQAASAPPVLKQHGGYLITGGSGALGLKLAHHLAVTCGARLVLLGRRPLSDAIRRQLDALVQAGAAEAHYRAVDLADAQALAACADSLPFALAGVVHAAGVESTEPFFERTPAGIDAVLQPKTLGTLHLEQAFARQPLDFVCHFSSSSALLGDVGSCDYAIANRFQMAHAEHRRASGGRGATLVVNWPLWAEGGMGVADAQQSAQYLKRAGLDALATAEGLATWQALLAAGEPQALVLAGRASRIDAMLDRIYRPRRAAPATPQLTLQELQRLKQLIKADLLSLQAQGE